MWPAGAVGRCSRPNGMSPGRMPMTEAVAIQSPPPKLADYVLTGPGTPAGTYLRKFWNPIYHSADLKAGRPVPLTIMSEQFTLYRGDSGQAFLVEARCPHRGTQLSSAWVMGDALRCFYHG